jgi:hypothetical protein
MSPVMGGHVDEVDASRPILAGPLTVAPTILDFRVWILDWGMPDQPIGLEVDSLPGSIKLG